MGYWIAEETTHKIYYVAHLTSFSIDSDSKNVVFLRINSLYIY